MKGSQIHLALAHWKWHTPRIEKLSKALLMCSWCNSSSALPLAIYELMVIFSRPRWPQVNVTLRFRNSWNQITALNHSLERTILSFCSSIFLGKIDRFKIPKLFIAGFTIWVLIYWNQLLDADDSSRCQADACCWFISVYKGPSAITVPESTFPQYPTIDLLNISLLRGPLTEKLSSSIG
jgi:hypothetical protein